MQWSECLIKIVILILMVWVSLNAKELTLGVVPQQSPLKLSKDWNKVTQYLSEKTGITVIFKTESTIPLFEEKLYSGEYDIAYMNPYHFVIANKTANYQAKIRSNQDLVGILLSKNKDFIVNKENLLGKTFLYPAPNAFAATLLTKYELKNKFNLDIEKDAKILYVNSHDSVYKGIQREIGDIGGGIVRTFEDFNEQETQKLHIVYKTHNYPSHPIAFHSNVNDEDMKKLVEAFITMPKEIKEALNIDQFIQTSNSEYDLIKAFTK